MKKLLFLTILISSFLLLPRINPPLANSELGHESEIEEGKKLVENEVSCDELNDEQLEAIGEYLMEQMHPGQSHEAMHKMMGMEEGTEYHQQFHVNMAKMMYCSGGGVRGSVGMMGMPAMNPIRQLAERGSWMPMMMNMMSDGMMGNFGVNPMGWFGFGWIFMILFWVLVIAGIIALIKWLVNQSKSETKGKSSIDILKERYAKGEIEKKEFEEKMKDLI